MGLKEAADEGLKESKKTLLETGGKGIENIVIGSLATLSP